MLKLFAKVPKIISSIANLSCVILCEEVIKMQLGKNIYNLRKKKGLSQENLSEKINVTRQTISNWELGETYPNPEQLILLSKALQISIDELVDNDFTQVNKEVFSNLFIRNIYLGFIAICGILASIWTFTANRFTYYEIFFLVLAAMLAGLFFAFICHNILKYLKNKDD